MSELILRARWVMPVETPLIEGGYVGASGGVIDFVGSRKPVGGQIQDLGDVLLAPGLVNPHTHLEFSDLKQPLGKPAARLPDWIGQVIANRKQAARDRGAALIAGLAESLHCGVTTIGEITTGVAAEYAGRSDAGAETAPGLIPTPLLTLFHESIAFSERRIESASTDLLRRFDESETASNGFGRLGWSPHAPYSVHPELIRRIVALARRRNSIVAMHLAESVEELQLLASGTGAFYELLERRSMWDARALEVGSRPLDYLRWLADAPRATIIHGNYLRADEIDYVGERRDRLSVVYCPRTHQYFQHGRYPLPSLLQANVRVAVGTDSRASNPDLNLLADLREAIWRHPEVSPEAIWRMGTVDAAFAVGLEDAVGSISVGKRADLVALPLPRTDAHPEEAALFTPGPSGVWLAGRRVDLSRSS